LCAQLVDGNGHCRPEKFGFSPRDDVALLRGVQYNLDAFHWTILLKPHNGVNCPGEPPGDLLDRQLGTAAQPRGNCSVMCVKNYLH